MNIWNKINEMDIEIAFINENNDKKELEKIVWKMGKILTDNVTSEFTKAIQWSIEQEEQVTPF